MMEFKIEPAGVTNWLLAFVAAPQWSHGGHTIRTGHIGAPIRLLGHISGCLREGPIGVVVLVVEATGVAQVIAGFISAPQGSRSGATIDTFLGCAHVLVFSLSLSLDYNYYYFYDDKIIFVCVCVSNLLCVIIRLMSE